MSHKVDLKKLVHLIKHRNCNGMRCHSADGTVCPLYETMCDAGCVFKTRNMKKEIQKAMEFHNIVKGDLVAHMIGAQEDDGEQ